MTRSLAGIAVLAMAIVLAVAASAGADTYSVYSCKGPTGAPNGAAGWATAPAPSGEGRATNACPAQGPLSVYLDAATPGGNASGTWTFAAPADTRIVRFAARRRTVGVTQGTQANDVQYVLATDQGTLESCSISDTSSCVADLVEPIDKQGLDAAWVQFRVRCTDAGSFCTRPLRADFGNVIVGLKDTSAPTVANVATIDDGETSGVLAARFDAADRGGGLYRAVSRSTASRRRPSRSAMPAAPTRTPRTATRTSSWRPCRARPQPRACRSRSTTAR
jgi:hypothetical protein